MKLHQIRNATIVCEMGPYRILVDPMLGHKAEHPPLRIFGQRQRNPLVELPVSAEALLDSVSHCLITHCQKGHFDHLDRSATRWLQARQIPVICTPHDAGYLARRGLNVQPLSAEHRHPQPFLGGTISTVGCTHGRGLVGHFMEHGVGYFIRIPGEPGLYLSGDTVLTETVRQFVRQHQPEVLVVPAGGARMDIGSEIIMGVEEVIEITRLSSGWVIANHLEALSHCPVSREELHAAAREAGLEARLLIPADGAVLTLEQAPVQALQPA